MATQTNSLLTVPWTTYQEQSALCYYQKSTCSTTPSTSLQSIHVANYGHFMGTMPRVHNVIISLLHDRRRLTPVFDREIDILIYPKDRHLHTSPCKNLSSAWIKTSLLNKHNRLTILMHLRPIFIDNVALHDCYSWMSLFSFQCPKFASKYISL